MKKLAPRGSRKPRKLHALPGAPFQARGTLGGRTLTAACGPHSVLLPITAPEVGSRIFCFFTQNSSWTREESKRNLALTREGSQGQNQVLKNGKPASTSPFQLMKVLGFQERKNVFTLFHKLDSSPHPPSTPSKLVLLFVQVERPGGYRNPTSSPRAPAEGMEFSAVIFLYGNVWFGVPGFVSQRERECVEVDLIKIGISYI